MEQEGKKMLENHLFQNLLDVIELTLSRIIYKKLVTSQH